MAHGLEARVPFLDKDFLDVAMRIDPEAVLKRMMVQKKYILRKAFDNSPYLPVEVLWRQKNSF
jgi:asparagine synthase (glutamine-hydrolysing)